VTVIIHQAICGEVNKAWDLIKTTLSDPAVGKRIAFQADLQDSPPSGISWLPEVRGFLFGEFFLIMKTYPDSSVGVRNGRVFSHVLLLNKLDVHLISDISILFKAFKPDVDKSMDLSPISLSIEEITVGLESPLRSRFNQVIRTLANMPHEQAVIVWIGQSNYQTALCRLWQILSPHQRENLYFGINFDPTIVQKEKISFIAVPESLTHKFENKGFSVVKPDTTVNLTEFAEQYLAGDVTVVAQIHAFANAIESSEMSRKDVSLVAKGITTFQKIESTTDIKLLNTLSQIVAKFSPKENKGTPAKSRIIEQITVLIDSATVDDIFLLRNFPTQSFKNSEKIISSAVEKWCSNFLFDGGKSQKKNISDFIIEIYPSTQTNWLINLIQKTIKVFLQRIDDSAAEIILSWTRFQNDTLKHIGFDIESSKSAEACFIRASESIDNMPLEEIRAFSLNKGWLKFHAKMLTLALPFKEALEAQLKVDTTSTFFEGIEMIIEGVDKMEILEATLVNGDQRCIKVSGQLCSKHPALLKSLVSSDEVWREIWVAAIGHGNDLTTGLKNPRKVIEGIFDEMVLGKSISALLVQKIGESEFGDILDYHKRHLLWKKIPSHIRGPFLKKTSSKFLESLSKDPSYQVPPDKELAEYVIDRAISTFLYYNRSNAKAVLPIFSTYTQLPEQIIKDYVSNYIGKIDAFSSTQLGTLILNRNFTTTAYIIFSKTHQNSDFRFALAECYPLLDFFTRGLMRLTRMISNVTITMDQWWVAFSDLAIRLYPGGPTENKIWKEADGEEYDLIFRVTGKEAWLNALQKLRHGGCTGVTVKKLLKAMKKDFSNNGDLQTLKDLWNDL
jgi:hypothetical protein